MKRTLIKRLAALDCYFYQGNYAKVITPNDTYGAKPSYHITTQRWNVRRFYTVAELTLWCQWLEQGCKVSFEAFSGK